MNDDKTRKSALKVNKGIEQPQSVDRDSVNKFKKKRKKILTSDDLLKGILAGDITILGQAITTIESRHPKHQEIAQKLIKSCLPYTGKSNRIGITGVPGSGKSSFIEAIGTKLISAGHKLAVLAIDPSSNLSKGSILGDKTRMEKLSANPSAFIRPSPSSGTLGGVASKTRESMLLCEAAGFDIIFIETVGVGQSETIVRSMVDLFLLLMIPGAGDELQGIKRGVMEMADIVAITKADGNNIQAAENASLEYQNALHLFPATDSGWEPRVRTCSALKKTGLDELWNIILDYLKLTAENNFFEKQRKQQLLLWMTSAINEKLHNSFYKRQSAADNIKIIEKEVLSGKISPYAAAEKLLDDYFKSS